MDSVTATQVDGDYYVLECSVCGPVGLTLCAVADLIARDHVSAHAKEPL